MTSKLLIEEHFDCSPQQLFDLLSDDNFDDELMKALNIQKEVLSNEKTSDGPKLKLCLTTPDEIPSFARKFIGDKLSYVETRTWHKGTLSNNWVIEPKISIGSIKIDVRGTITISAADNGCIRRTEGEFSVGIPLVGKKVEDMLQVGVKDTYNKNAEYCRKYIKEHLK